jgi:AcrR family transcriptional regulator
VVTRRRLTRAAREVVMLDAAERDFGEHGFRGASMASIAQGAGITPALLYQYFGSKEGLYAACIERARATLFGDLERAALAGPPGGELRAFATAYFAHLDAQRGTWSLLYGEAPADVADTMRDRNATTIAAVLERVLGAHDAVDVAIVAHALTGAGEQVGRWWAAHPEVPRDVVVARFVALGEGIAAALAGRTLPG